MLICGANTQINHDIQDKYHETGQQISKLPLKFLKKYFRSIKKVCKEDAYEFK